MHLDAPISSLWGSTEFPSTYTIRCFRENLRINTTSVYLEVHVTLKTAIKAAEDNTQGNVGIMKSSNQNPTLPKILTLTERLLH